MPKTRAKRRQATVYRDAETPPTPEFIAKHELERIEAPRIPGHDGGNVQTVRRRPVIDKWLDDGILTQQSHAAMERWQNYRLKSGQVSIPSCCDDTPRGSSGTFGPSDHMVDAGRRFAAINLELASIVGPHVVRMVQFLICATSEGVDGDPPITLSQAYRDAFSPCRTQDAIMRGRSSVKKVGDALLQIRA